MARSVPFIGMRGTNASRIAACLALATLLAPIPSFAQRHRHRRRGGGAIETATPPGGTQSAATPTAGGTQAATPPSGGAAGTNASSGATGSTASTPAGGSAGASTTPGATTAAPEIPPPTSRGGAAASHTREVLPPPPPSADPPRARPVVIDVALSPRVLVRSLVYNDDLFTAMRRYDVTAFTVGGSLEFFPGAIGSSGPASWFGITGAGEYYIPIPAHDRLGRAYPTTAYSFSGGLRVRVPVERHEIGGTVAYGRHEYSIGGTAQGNIEGIANATYNYLRIGAVARIRVLERLSILANGAYLVALGAGDVLSYQRPTTNGDVRTTYFPNAGAGGIELGAGVAWTLGAGIELRGNFDWRRFFFGMNPMPADTWIVGGATDDYYQATFSVAFRR